MNVELQWLDGSSRVEMASNNRLMVTIRWYDRNNVWHESVFGLSFLPDGVNRESLVLTVDGKPRLEWTGDGPPLGRGADARCENMLKPIRVFVDEWPFWGTGS